MHAIKIYDVEYYQPFHFKTQLDKSYLKSESRKAIVFSNNGYFAISRERFEQLPNKDGAMVLEIERLNRQGIVIGKLHQSLFNNDEQYQSFSRQLIYEEIYCVRYFLRLITVHLEFRESEARKLTNHDNVRILIGAIVQYVEEIEALLELEILTRPVKNYIAQVVRTACNQLAKLAGGRSFIASSVIEMLCTFEALNKIYLH